MKQAYTAEQLVERFEIRREVQNLMGKYSLSYCIKQEGELMRYWSSRDDICLGVNEGYYLGQQDIAAYYRALGEEIALASTLICRRFPDKVKDVPEENRFGIGQISYRPIDTPVVEVAGDSQTAKGLWVCRGLVEKITPAGPVSYWDWSYWAVDFILEDGQWKIWHMQDLHEVFAEQGLNFTDLPAEAAPDPAFAEMAKVVIPAPTKPCTLRETYSAHRAMTPPPSVPEPYSTFAETFSYGI